MMKPKKKLNTGSDVQSMKMEIQRLNEEILSLKMQLDAKDRWMNFYKNNPRPVLK